MNAPALKVRVGVATLLAVGRADSELIVRQQLIGSSLNRFHRHRSRDKKRRTVKITSCVCKTAEPLLQRLPE